MANNTDAYDNRLAFTGRGRGESARITVAFTRHCNGRAPVQTLDSSLWVLPDKVILIRIAFIIQSTFRRTGATKSITARLANLLNVGGFF